MSAEDSGALVQELSALFKVMAERAKGSAVDRPFNSPYYWAGFQASHIYTVYIIYIQYILYEEIHNIYTNRESQRSENERRVHLISGRTHNTECVCRIFMLL